MALVLLSLTPSETRTQTPPASLFADRVTYDDETGVLTATGNVEVYYQGRVLRAAGIAYNSDAEEIRATGPLVLTDPDGTVFQADAAALSPELTEGLIEGARLLIAGQLQVAASEIRRGGDRYTVLSNTVASSCRICIENPTPTWAVRASRITQDDVARRLYFENATVEFFGLPVAYLPRLSFPDPRVGRASGFLLPSFQQSNIYGFGFKLPYYRVLGPYADATVTPFITTKGSLLFEGEYRRRSANGGFDIAGVFALDDGLGTGHGRGFVTSAGGYDLGGGFTSDFDLNYVSDRSFLQQFDYSDADRLTSIVRLRRSREQDDFELAALGFQSLRENEDTGVVPFVFTDFNYRRHLNVPAFGGRLTANLDVLGLTRDVGTDVLRGGGGADWRRDWVLPNGLLATATADAQFDAYQVRDAAAGEPDGTMARLVPGAGVELRWPLVRDTTRAAHVIEPIAQVLTTQLIGEEDVPNEDSRLPEFDETNLFWRNRFPGRDRYELGLRANLGVSYTRYDPSGWSLGLTLGRVLRSESEDDFAEGVGLAGRWSDYVSSLQVDFDSGLTVVNRALFDDDLTFRRNELALGYDGDRADLVAAYVFLSADQSNSILGPLPETNEFLIDAAYLVRPNWELRGNWRYDVATDSPLRAGGGVTYGNECAEFDLSVSRRFTSSANVPPSTSFRFVVRLAGLGDSDDREWPPRACMRRGT